MKLKIIAVVLIVLFVIGSIFCIRAHCLHRHLHELGKITVSGEAVVNVKPDKVVIKCEIETVDKNILIAKQKNTDIFTKTIAAIKALGIEEKDIQTDHLSSGPKYKNNDRDEVFIGYSVENTFAVTLTDTDKKEALINKLFETGVKDINGIDFQTTEFKKYREEARTLALQAAKEKAEKMAAVLGQSVGEPISIVENATSGWGYLNRALNSQMAYNDDPNPPSRTGSGDASDTIVLGTIPVRGSVTVTFELRPAPPHPQK